MPTIYSLPNDVLKLILSYLPFSDEAHFAQVSKAWYLLAFSIRRDFPLKRKFFFSITDKQLGNILKECLENKLLFISKDINTNQNNVTFYIHGDFIAKNFHSYLEKFFLTTININDRTLRKDVYAVSVPASMLLEKFDGLVLNCDSSIGAALVSAEKISAIILKYKPTMNMLENSFDNFYEEFLNKRKLYILELDKNEQQLLMSNLHKKLAVMAQDQRVMKRKQAVMVKGQQVMKRKLIKVAQKQEVIKQKNIKLQDTVKKLEDKLDEFKELLKSCPQYHPQISSSFFSNKSGYTPVVPSYNLTEEQQEGITFIEQYQAICRHKIEMEEKMKICLQTSNYKESDQPLNKHYRKT